jgi:hypothetical protein
MEDYAQSTINRYNLVDEEGRKYKITYFKGREHRAYMKEGKKLMMFGLFQKVQIRQEKLKLFTRHKTRSNFRKNN